MGCGDNGIGYVLTGNTYPVKDTIKANGGKWISQTWVAPVQIESKGVQTTRIDANEYVNACGEILESNVRDLVFCIGVHGMNLETAKATVKEWNNG